MQGTMEVPKTFNWANSSIRRVLEESYNAGERCWLLGDSGYPLEPWLHTPILNAPENSPEENYTRMHLHASSAVERAIGSLKDRFRCLLRHRALHYSPLEAGLIVNACCALHNMCLQGNLPEEEDDPVDIPAEPEGNHPPAAQTERREN